MVVGPDEVTAIMCCNCKTEFAPRKSFVAAKQKDHTTWYCPNGHPNCFPEPPGDSKQVKDLKDKVSRLEAQVTHLRDELDATRAEKYDPGYTAWLERETHKEKSTEERR